MVYMGSAVPLGLCALTAEGVRNEQTQDEHEAVAAVRSGLTSQRGWVRGDAKHDIAADG